MGRKILNYWAEYKHAVSKNCRFFTGYIIINLLFVTFLPIAYICIGRLFAVLGLAIAILLVILACRYVSLSRIRRRPK